MVEEERSEREKGAAELEDDCRMEARRNCVVAAATAVETMMSWRRSRLYIGPGTKHLHRRPMRMAYCGVFLLGPSNKLPMRRQLQAKYEIRHIHHVSIFDPFPRFSKPFSDENLISTTIVSAGFPVWKISCRQILSLQMQYKWWRGDSSMKWAESFEKASSSA
jgi:hypothetical protein